MVQNLQKTRTRSVGSMEENGIFVGMIYCADCRHAMSRKYARRGERGFIGYVCKTYKTQGKQFCESHSIDIEDLKEAVLYSVKDEARSILKPEDIDELKKMEIYDESKNYYETQIADFQRRIEKIEKFKRKTYNNYMEDLISKEEYAEYTSEYDNEIRELQLQQSTIQNKSELQQELDNQYDEWVEAFRDYINVTELTRDMILELIDRIEVNGDSSITIFYKFENPYKS